MAQPVAAYQQPEVLLRHLQEAGVTHGHEGRVTIRRVHVDDPDRVPEPADLFFCSMRGVALLNTNEIGDGGPLDPNVVLVGDFIMPATPGYYDLTVHVHANSRTELSAPQWEPAELMIDRRRPAPWSLAA